MERIGKNIRTGRRVSHVHGSLKNQRAISLVELQVGIVMAAMLVLTIGVLSNIAYSSYGKISEEEMVYNDVTYVFKQIQNKIRSSTSMSVKTNPANPPWKSSQLLFKYPKVVDGVETSVQGAFGLYQTNGNPMIDLVYVPDTTQANKEILMSVKANQILNFTFSNVTAQSLTIRLQGNMNGIPFDMSAVVLRRIM